MGIGMSYLSKTQLDKLLESTCFTEAEIKQLINIYSGYISHNECDPGMPQEELVNISPFNTNFILRRAVEINQKDKTMFAPQFVQMCSMLSSKASLSEKKMLAFRCLNFEYPSKLSHNELFYLYKSVCDNWIPNDTLLQMVFKTLSVPTVCSVPEVLWTDFKQNVDEAVIGELFTHDFLDIDR